MATTTADPKISLADAGPCRKKLAFEIPAPTVAEALQTAYAAYMENAALPGFRKGKAPKGLIERMFGKSAREEARNRLVSAAYQKAMEQHKLRVVGDPEGGEDLAEAELSPEKPLSFTLEVEVAPEFTMPALEGIPVKKPLYAVSDDMLNEELHRIATHEGDLVEREKAEPGDYCTGKGIILDESGKNVLEIDGAVIQIPEEKSKGKGAIMGVLVDDFAKQIGAPKSGETIKVKAKGPAHHEVISIQGKPITIEFQVDRVDRIQPVALADLAQRLGVETEDRLREAVKQRLEMRTNVRQQAAMRRQIADHLLSSVKMELPTKMSERQAARNLERRRLELMYRGFPPMQVEQQIAEMRAASSDAAARELKMFFLLDRVATDLKVQVSENEINQRIVQMAIDRGERPERLRNELIRNNQVGMLVQQVREHKAMDALLSKASISDVSPEEFDKADAKD